VTEIRYGQFEVDRCIWWGKRLRIVKTTTGDIVLCSYEHGTQLYHLLSQMDKFLVYGIAAMWGLVAFIWVVAFALVLYAR
jgi:hypothetical protein